MKLRLAMLLTILALAGTAAPGQVPLTTGFTYQGRLDQAGQPFNGNADFVFRLYNAAGGGSLLGSQTLNNVAVSDGLFTVVLNSSGQFGGNAFDGERRWLEISVNGTALAPRQEVTAAPYALALRLPFSGQASAPGGAPLQVANTSTSGGSSGIRGIGAATGSTYGVWGESDSPTGTGTFGWATHSSGANAGVYGQSDSSAGRAVQGLATAPSGTAYGGYFESASSSGRGVYAASTAASGNTYGIYGDTVSPTGVGVRGRAQASTGTNYGGFFATNSSSGVGVYGDVNATTGTNYGVWGEVASTSGRGVYGHAAASSGFAVGVYGRSESSGGVGGLFANGGGGTALQTSANGSTPGADFNQLGSGVGVRITNSNSSNPNPALLVTQSNANAPALQVNGTARVSILEIAGADVAERIPLADGESVSPGMVVMLDERNPGKLRRAHGAYNRCVAGVVSGANGLSPGTILGHMPGLEEAPPIAMSGRVWVCCDASAAAIAIGDLLTTSDRAGHAMAARDASRSHGAVIGKAMTALPAGESGLVLVLVNLQ